MTAAQHHDHAPPRHGFELETIARGDHADIRARGEIDLATVPAIEAQVHAIYARGVDAVVLDLSEVSFMDSTGLRLLLRLNAGAETEPHRSFVLGDCSRAVRRLLELTRLETRFSVASARTAA